MATFNPQVPQTQDPNYLFWSRPIEQPRPDESLAYLVKGVNDIVSEGVAGADTVIKKDIDTGMHNQVDAERGAFTTALEGKDAVNHLQGLQGQGPATPDANNPNPQEMPPSLKSMPQSIESLGAARANGRISETYYLGRLDSIAKDMRARYPGYRDYIDEKMSNMTRLGPANQYVRSLLADINTFQENTQKEHEKLNTMFLDNIGIIGEPNYTAWRNGQRTDSSLLQTLAERKKQVADLELSNLQRNDIKGNRELLQTHTLDTANGWIRDQVNNSIKDFFENTKLGSDQQTALDFIKGQADGTGQMDPVAARALGERMTAAQTAMEASIRAKFNQTMKDTNGNTTSWGQDINDPAKINAAIQEGLKPYQVWTDWIKDQQFGPAYRAYNYIKGVDQATQKGLLDDPDVGGYMRTGQAIKGLGLDKLSQDFFEMGIKTGAGSAFQSYLLKKSQDWMTQPDPNHVTSIGDISSKAAAAGATPDVQQHIFDMPTAILRKDVPDAEKLQMIKGTFDPTTRAALTRVENDHIDSSGLFVPGKFTVYSKLTSPAMSAEIKRLSAGNPSVWWNYQEWATTSFGTMFNQEIHNLNDYQKIPGVELAWHASDGKNPPFWSMDVGHSLGASGEEAPRRFRLANDPKLQNIKEGIDRLNTGLKGLASVSREGGLDPDSVVLKLMTNLGFDPSISSPKGVPDQMIQSIVNSRKTSQEFWTDKKVETKPNAFRKMGE